MEDGVVVNDMTFKLGGEAGMGVESNGAGFLKAFARGGLFVFGQQSYMSRIRGGHNFYQIRVKDQPLYTHTEPVHLLLAFDEETVADHLEEVVEGGGIIYDEGLKVSREEIERRGVHAFPSPLVKIAKEVGGNKLMVNTAALGVATGVTGYDLERITEVMAENFSGRKGAQVAEANLKVAAAGYEFAQERYAEVFRWKLRPLEAPRRMVMNGTQGISLGALAGGCRFMSSYPMTPASGIMEYLAGKARKYGLVVKQTGDEIEAILMAIGAAHTGVRALAATSGGGFSLMVEALGLAGATETPLVVVEAQRPGPSTGLPTQTEQGDLLFLLHASQGEFPRMLFAPGTVEQCFEVTWRAFNMAEKYQTPVLVLTDGFLQNALRSISREAIDFASVEIDRGLLLTDEELERLPDGYRRYQVTESGISPRALPGHPKAVFHVTSDEHTEEGFITEEADMRIAQMEKRMRKLEAAKKDIRDPGLYGPEKADVTLVCWGSTYGAVREAVDRLNSNGLSANMLHIVDVWPFPSERVGEMLSKANYRIMVEGNYTGQMARLIRAETGIAMDFNVLRYDGRPFSPEYVLRKLERVLEVRV